MVPGQTVIRTPKNPIKPTGGMAVLRGNLAPRGAVIKHAAASPALLTHTGRAVVFDSLEDLAARGDDPKLDVTADDILVLRNAGPKGAPGMPEAGSFPIPMKLARAGVKDMIRISDARMSGTAFGTIVLHVAPEAAVGGPLALVKTGDRITLDVPKRKLELLVSADELAKRRKAWKAPAPHHGSDRGYTGLFHQHRAAGRRRRRLRLPGAGEDSERASTLPQISVVVTCYNCRDYIADAIRSVARQTLRDFDCVIVDDASTDDSAADRAAHARGAGQRSALPAGPPGEECRPDRRDARRPRRRRTAPFVCFLDSDDLWNDDFLERHLAAHLNESYAVGFTACNARLIDGQGALIAGAVYWFGKDRAVADRGRAFAPIDPARVPAIDPAKKSADWRRQTPYRLYTKRLVHWVWVIDLVDDVPPFADRSRLPRRRRGLPPAHGFLRRRHGADGFRLTADR